MDREIDTYIAHRQIEIKRKRYREGRERGAGRREWVQREGQGGREWVQREVGRYKYIYIYNMRE